MLIYVIGGVGTRRMYLECADTHITDKNLPNGNMFP